MYLKNFTHFLIMFGEKCINCNMKVSGKYSFCPNCGNPAKRLNGKNSGMLGENDFEERNNFMEESFIEKLGGKMINKVFENAVRMIEKEMSKEMKRQSSPQSQPKSNFQLFVNGKKVNMGNLQPKKEERVEKEAPIELPNEPLKDFSKFPRKEPQTNVKRLSDKVLYEVSMPGIKTEKDVSIVNLENSIEIKGIGKEVSYQKILPVSLPITGYNLSRGKLVLELGLRE